MSLLRFPLRIENQQIPFRHRLWIILEWVGEGALFLMCMAGVAVAVYLIYIFLQMMAVVPGD